MIGGSPKGWTAMQWEAMTPSHGPEKPEVEADVDAEDPGAQVTLPREAQELIGKHLRRTYGAVLAEPIPDRFTRLIEELARTETEQKD